MSAVQNDLPEYLGLPDSRCRISVAGVDLKRAQLLLGLTSR
jgi:hypothetical protein